MPKPITSLISELKPSTVIFCYHQDCEGRLVERIFEALHPHVETLPIPIPYLGTESIQDGDVPLFGPTEFSGPTIVILSLGPFHGDRKRASNILSRACRCAAESGHWYSILLLESEKLLLVI
jgi:hypothetical protein